MLRLWENGAGLALSDRLGNFCVFLQLSALRESDLSVDAQMDDDLIRLLLAKSIDPYALQRPLRVRGSHIRWLTLQPIELPFLI